MRIKTENQLGLPLDCGDQYGEDMARESRIRGAKQQMLKAESSAGRRAAWATMQREINARSPEQVLRMEIEKGLV